MSRARETRLKAVAMLNNRFWNVLSLSIFLPRFSSDDWLPWGVKILGGVDYEFSCWVFELGIHSYFGFVGHIVSQRLASRKSPALSWFSAVAERTFGYASKSKLKFCLWILNSCFDHLLNILGVCSVGVWSAS